MGKCLQEPFQGDYTGITIGIQSFIPYRAPGELLSMLGLPRTIVGGHRCPFDLLAVSLSPKPFVPNVFLKTSSCSLILWEILSLAQVVLGFRV